MKIFLRKQSSHWSWAGIALFSVFSAFLNHSAEAATDKQAPSIPTGLKAQSASASQINLSWLPSTDNVKVSGYKLYRCQGAGCTPNTLLTTIATLGVSSTTYLDSNLTSLTTYVYAVSAFDTANNQSRLSSSVSGTTQAPPDTQAPSVFITSPTAGSSFKAAQTVTVSATAQDNVKVSKVEFYVDGVLKSTSLATPYSYNWEITNALNGTHSLNAKAYDAANNSATSSIISVDIAIPSPKELAIYEYIKTQVSPLVGNGNIGDSSVPQLPSLVIGVILPDGSQVLTFGDVGSGRLPKETDIYPLSSMTKLLTGLILAKGVVGHDFEKTTRVSSLLSTDLAAWVGNRTLGQLVSHYASYRPMPANLRFDQFPYAPATSYSRDDLKQCLSNWSCSQITAPVGSTYVYSNLGLGLLGVALTDFYRQSYQSLLELKITRELGMSKTYTSPALYSTNDSIVQGWTRLRDRVPPATMGVLEGSGAALSSAQDLMKLMRQLITPSDSWKEPIQLATTPIQADAEIGFAIDIHAIYPHVLYSKSGEQAGYSSFILWNPIGKAGVFTLTNMGGSSSLLADFAANLHKKIASEYSF